MMRCFIRMNGETSGNIVLVEILCDTCFVVLLSHRRTRRKLVDEKHNKYLGIDCTSIEVQKIWRTFWEFIEIITQKWVNILFEVSLPSLFYKMHVCKSVFLKICTFKVNLNCKPFSKYYHYFTIFGDAHPLFFVVVSAVTNIFSASSCWTRGFALNIK